MQAAGPAGASFSCMRGALRAAAAAAVLVAVACSCVLGPTALVRVELPTLPDQWQHAFSAFQCLLVWPDGSGAPQSRLLSGWASGACLSCPSSGNTPVLAFPLTDFDQRDGRPGFLRPAGGLFPAGIRDGPRGETLVLSWEEGPTASVVLALGSLGRDTSLFNAQRLTQEILAQPDPWDLDLRSMAEKIAAGTFTAWDIDPLPCRDVELFIGAGSWTLESPFRPPAEADASGRVLLPGLSLGQHLLASVPGAATLLEVRAQETITFTLVPANAAAAGRSPHSVDGGFER